jgi:hypothetical protein
MVWHKLFPITVWNCPYAASLHVILSRKGMKIQKYVLAKILLDNFHNIGTLSETAFPLRCSIRQKH